MSPQPLPPRPLTPQEIVALTESDDSDLRLAMVAGRPERGTVHVVHARHGDTLYLLGFDADRGEWEEVADASALDARRERHARSHDGTTAALLALRDVTREWVAERYDGDLYVVDPAGGRVPA